MSEPSQEGEIMARAYQQLREHLENHQLKCPDCMRLYWVLLRATNICLEKIGGAISLDDHSEAETTDCWERGIPSSLTLEKINREKKMDDEEKPKRHPGLFGGNGKSS